MTRRDEYLYTLLPGTIRERDRSELEPLRALLLVLQEAHDDLEEQITAALDDWFIETCRPEVVPAIAALLDVQWFGAPGHWVPGWRQLVADTLAHRAANGTRRTLQAVAHQATDWPVRLETSADLIAISADLRVPGASSTNRALRRRTRSAAADYGYARIGACRTADATTARTLNTFTFAFWRALPRSVVARACARTNPSRYTFDIQGGAHALISGPPATGEPPDRLTVAVLDNLLRRGAQLPFEVRDAATGVQWPAGRMRAADLSAWQDYTTSDDLVLIDPSAGRMLLPGPSAGRELQVTYTYADANLGIGARAERLLLPSTRLELSTVDDTGRAVAPTPAETTSLANAFPAGSDHRQPFKIVQLADSAVQDLDTLPVYVLPGETLIIEADLGAIPVLSGTLHIRARRQALPATVILDGLCVRGTVQVIGNVNLVIRSCTLRCSDAPAVTVKTSTNTRIVIRQSIVSSIEVTGPAGALDIEECVIEMDSQGHALSGGLLDNLRASTLFGACRVQRIGQITDCLLLGGLHADDPAAGVIRHSYVPEGTRLPATEACSTRSVDRPRITSRTFGHAGFARLAPGARAQITRGAHDAGEIGIGHRSAWAVREAVFSRVCEDHLPAGWSAQVHTLS